MGYNAAGRREDIKSRLNRVRPGDGTASVAAPRTIAGARPCCDHPSWSGGPGGGTHAQDVAVSLLTHGTWGIGHKDRASELPVCTT